MERKKLLLVNQVKVKLGSQSESCRIETVWCALNNIQQSRTTEEREKERKRKCQDASSKQLTWAVTV